MAGVLGRITVEAGECGGRMRRRLDAQPPPATMGRFELAGGPYLAAAGPAGEGWCAVRQPGPGGPRQGGAHPLTLPRRGSVC